MLDPELFEEDSDELEVIALVRSRERVPESPDACCANDASVAVEPGFVVPKAHMTVCVLSELA